MSLRPETKAVHSAATDPASGAIVPPIVLSTTFEYETTELEHDADQLIYTRWQNPNRAAFESTMAALEGGASRPCRFKWLGGDADGFSGAEARRSHRLER